MADPRQFSCLLRDPVTGEALLPKRQPGYYQNFRTLDQKKFWDAATRKVVEERVKTPPPIRFFTPEQAEIMQAVCNQLLPQDDRLPEYRIPIINVIDDRLWNNQISGYRFEDMPDDRRAYQLGMEAINLTSLAMTGKSFTQTECLERDRVLRSIHDGQQLAASDIWAQMPIQRFWSLLMQDCVAAYYSHPWAWDEIGFGGPAYPRAYMRLEQGLPEPWETDECRYEWKAPSCSLSDLDEEKDR